jgi:hypothetical protein
MDSAGEPRVVYIKGSGTEIDYALRSGGTWSFETIAVIPGQALATSLVLDSLDRPHVAYDEFLAVGIQYAMRTPAGWTTSLVDSGQRDPDARAHRRVQRMVPLPATTPMLVSWRFVG